MKHLRIVAWWFLLPIACAHAADVYVSADGDDGAPGTKNQPVASLHQARDLVRKKKAGGMSADVIVEIAPGRYFQDSTTVFDERDAGRDGHQIIYRGLGNRASAAFYGGVPVTGWEKWKGNVWRAPVPKGVRFFNIVVDDLPAILAQTPNAGSGYGGGAGLLGNSAVQVPESWKKYDFADAQVAGFIGGNWFAELRLATSYDTTRRILSIDPGSSNFNGLNSRFVVRGVLDFLDEPGEWCLKHHEGYLYYWPLSGTPADHLIVRTTSPRLIELRGRSPQTPVRGLAFENVSFVGSDGCASWRIFSTKEPDNSTPEPMQTGLVYGENIEEVSFQRCRFLAAGDSAVFLNRHAQRCSVEGSMILDAGVNGVCLNSWAPGAGGFKTASESYINKGHRIVNNFIARCGRVIPVGVAGVRLYQSGDDLIANNEISDMSGFAISHNGIRFGCLPRNNYGRPLTFENQFDILHTRQIQVVGNHIHRVCCNEVDFGAVQCWGPGRDNLWERNAIHDIDASVEWDAWGHVMFPDDSTNYHTIRDNIIYHCAGGRGFNVFMLKGVHDIVENNFAADCICGHAGITFEPYVEPYREAVIRRNVFDIRAPIAYSSTDRTFTGLPKEMPPGERAIREVDNNCITPCDPANPNPYAGKGLDSHSYFGDPRIIRARPAWDIQFADYRLRDDSPALKLGFKPIDTADIGLRADFPFDTARATRRPVTGKIQAEQYQRMHGLRAIGGLGIGSITPGAWTKYENLDFGNGGSTRVVFQGDLGVADAKTSRVFIRRYGNEVVEAIPFAGDKSVEPIVAWEVSTTYGKAGKVGGELLDEIFAPETNETAGTWKFVRTPPPDSQNAGRVDLSALTDAKNGNVCAYLRASIYAPIGRTHATMTASCPAGVKVWLNGEVVIRGASGGSHSTILGVIKQGWNSVLVKVPASGHSGLPDFWVKLGTVASGCGEIVSLPGLPTNELAMGVNFSRIIEVHLDAPTGPLIGQLAAGQISCPVAKVAGIHNVFLVFPNQHVRLVDWFRFE